MTKEEPASARDGGGKVPEGTGAPPRPTPSLHADDEMESRRASAQTKADKKSSRNSSVALAPGAYR